MRRLRDHAAVPSRALPSIPPLGCSARARRARARCPSPPDHGEGIRHDGDRERIEAHLGSMSHAPDGRRPCSPPLRDQSVHPRADVTSDLAPSRRCARARPARRPHHAAPCSFGVVRPGALPELVAHRCATSAELQQRESHSGAHAAERTRPGSPRATDFGSSGTSRARAPALRTARARRTAPSLQTWWYHPPEILDSTTSGDVVPALQRLPSRSPITSRRLRLIARPSALSTRQRAAARLNRRSLPRPYSARPHACAAPYSPPNCDQVQLAGSIPAGAARRSRA